MRKKLRERIGKLMGGAAVLHVGGSTDTEIRMRKEKAERTAEALRGALASGVVAGGGAALLACRAVLQTQAERAADQDECTAYKILSRALEEPARVIITNAGYEAAPMIPQVNEPGMGFDVRCARLGDMLTMGVIDSAGVVLSAVHEAVASAALALTVDVFVHHRKPQVSVNP
jgi:chaperonin GroEL